MPEIFDLEPVDADNIAHWPEGMLGGAINNAGRADEGMLARQYEDHDSSRTASGAGNAFAVTSSRTIAALFDNLTMVFTANHTITGAATLDLNGIGAKSIKRFNNNDLTAGDIVSGTPVSVIYKLAADTWFMVSASAALFANMHADFNENAAPGDPAANVGRLYARDDGSGNTELAWRDSAGVISVLRQATAANMEAAAVDRLVAASLQHRHPGHPKAMGRGGSAGGIVGTSYNVASIVQNSTGFYTVTLTNAMADTNYAPIVTPVAGAGDMSSATANPTSTTTFTVHIRRPGSGGGSTETDRAFSFIVLGDMS